jgi:hypothetical protein
LIIEITLFDIGVFGDVVSHYTGTSGIDITAHNDSAAGSFRRIAPKRHAVGDGFFRSPDLAIFNLKDY